MGLFNNKEKRSSTELVRNTFGSTQSCSLRAELFNLLKDSKLNFGLILATFDIEEVRDLVNILSDLDEDISTNKIDITGMKYETINNLFKTLGKEITLKSGVITLSNIDLKERVKTVLEESYGDYIEDIKYVAYIEGNDEVYNAIPNKVSDEEYCTLELKNLCDKLTTIKYENFRLELID